MSIAYSESNQDINTDQPRHHSGILSLMDINIPSTNT